MFSRNISMYPRPLAGLNALIKTKCSGHTSSPMMDVLRCFAGVITSQTDRATFRDAEIPQLPAVRVSGAAATTTGTRFLKDGLEACKFPDRAWARRFMELEMNAASLYCLAGGEELLLEDGGERSTALRRSFEFVGEDELCDVTAVRRIEEQCTNLRCCEYSVLLFSDGSHLCECRTLQTLGLGCRHFWAAMHQSDSFRFQVGLLNEHWLTETARGTPHSEWPQAAVKWVVADRFRPAVGAVTEVFQKAPSLSVSALGSGSTGDESWKAFVLTGNFGGQTI